MKANVLVHEIKYLLTWGFIERCVLYEYHAVRQYGVSEVFEYHIVQNQTIRVKESA